MIKWYKQLYIDDVLKKKKEKIMKKLEEEKVTFDIYCIALASNDKNLFDIINTNELLFKHYKNNNIYIIGLAASRESAIHLAVSLLEEIYQKTGEFQVRNYYFS